MLDRRGFSAGMMASIAFAGLPACANRPGRGAYRSEVTGYGPLVADRRGLFDLPHGFSYRILSSAGDPMSDGFFVPDHADGMGCLPLADGRIALVRNHELKPEDRDKGAARGLARLEERLRAGRFFGSDAAGRTLPGGTTTLILDSAGTRVQRQYLSLAGTAVNCAGGTTPWGSWLSCEESVLTRADGLARDHGWVFEVPASADAAADPVPLVALGRFRHEAAAVDPRTGIVYLTEDRDDGLFYRFLPETRGVLARGGRLQALGLASAPAGSDLRNWAGRALDTGAWVDARWIDLDGVDNPLDDLRRRGHAKGATVFARGEGVHFGTGELYFCCTSGGAARLGQVMRYVPGPDEGRGSAGGRLQLFVESADSALLDYGDNLTVSPWGDLIVCEDRGDAPTENYLRGITRGGRIYTIGRHPGETELAGACFSPDGATLFLNLYSPARTLAITGPWSAIQA